MKIGITCHASAGGSGILATQLGMALAERGHEIHFVSTEVPYRLAGFHPNIYCHTVDTATYPLFGTPPMSLALAARIAEAAEEAEIDVWHAHYAIPNAISAVLARDMLPPERKFKLVTTLHGTDITLVGTDPSFYRITKYAMKKSDAVTSVSKWLTEETRREFAFDTPIETIYNFLDDKFPPEPPERCTLADDNEKILMHVSNFRPVKRVTDVVRIFKKVSEHVHSILVMVGDGPERMSAVGVAKQLGVLHRVKFLGSYDAIENILPCADLLLQPSEHESFGLAPLEAMACGVPVIGTNSGGVTEVVQHGVTGYLDEVGDIDTMAGHAIDILTNADLAKALGDAGRHRASTQFQKAPIIDQYENLYTRLLAEK